MMRFLVLAALVALVAVFAWASPASAESLVKSYDFNADYSDTLGNGLDLVGFGGVIAGGRYTFDYQEGLRLSDALPDATRYKIEFRFRMDDDPEYYNKLLDFDSQTTDTGLYVAPGSLLFYNETGSGPDPISVGTDYTVSLVRDGGMVTGSLDGVGQWTFDDSGPMVAVPSGNILHFFMGYRVR